MRRLKEILVLLVLLVAAAVFVLIYVRQRRAELRNKPAAPKTVGPVVTVPPLDLEKHHDQTIDFSSGKPVVKETPEDRAALQQGLKDIEEATRDMTFKAEKPAPKKP